jgi:fumarate reductase subunit C
MSAPSSSTERLPNTRPQPVPTFWWLGNASYFAFMLRELSCVFVAWFVVYLLFLVSAVSEGEAAYQAFVGWSGGLGILALNFVSLLFVVYHAVTFFSAAPQAIVVRIGGSRVPGSAIAASHYAGWVVVSAVVLWILVGV